MWKRTVETTGNVFGQMVMFLQTLAVDLLNELCCVLVCVMRRVFQYGLCVFCVCCAVLCYTLV